MTPKFPNFNDLGIDAIFGYGGSVKSILELDLRAIKEVIGNFSSINFKWKNYYPNDTLTGRSYVYEVLKIVPETNATEANSLELVKSENLPSDISVHEVEIDMSELDGADVLKIVNNVWGISNAQIRVKYLLTELFFVE